MNDAQSRYLIPEEGPACAVRHPQPDFPKLAESDINLTVGSAMNHLQAGDTAEPSGTSKSSKGAERGVNPLGKVAVSNGAEELPRSSSVEQHVQPAKSTLPQRHKTDNTQTQPSVLKMQPAKIAIPKTQTALTAAKSEKAMVEHLRSQRNEMKERNDDDCRSQETPLSRNHKSLRLNRLEQDSKTAGKSTPLSGRTQQSDPTRIKINQRIHPNQKGSTQRKAGGTGNSNATGLKESKASSKSRTSQNTSAGFHVEPCRAKNANDSLSTDLKVGKNSFSSKRGLVISKSALADLSSLSPRMNSAKTSPGSAPAKSPVSRGSNREVLWSSTSVSGDYIA